MGVTQFYESSRSCQQCILERRRKRYANPEKRAMDGKYQESWLEKNPGYMKQNDAERREATKKKKQTIYSKLIDRINRLVDHYQIEFPTNVIMLKIKADKTPEENFGSIYQAYLRRVKSNVKNYEQFRLTGVYTHEYRHTVPKQEWEGNFRPNYSQLPQNIKDQLKQEAIDNGQQIFEKLVKSES